MQFFALEHVAPAAGEHAVKQSEVHAENHHKDGNDHIHRDALKRAHAGPIIAEATRARRTHGMNRRVVGR